MDAAAQHYLSIILHVSSLTKDQNSKSEALFLFCMCSCSIAKSRPTLCDLPVSSVMGFSRQEHWSGLPLPSPGDLPNSGIELPSAVSPALADGFFTTEPPGNPSVLLLHHCRETLSLTNIDWGPSVNSSNSIPQKNFQMRKPKTSQSNEVLIFLGEMYICLFFYLWKIS